MIMKILLSFISPFIVGYLIVSLLDKLTKNCNSRTSGPRDDLKTIAKIKEIEFMRSFLDDRNSKN